MGTTSIPRFNLTIEMETILPSIGDWFLAKRDHFIAFAELDTRIEAWLKGEFIVLVRRLSEEGLVERFEREPKIVIPEGRKHVDLRLWLGGQSHLCELKALCISQAGGTPRNLAFYFRDDNLGVIRDMRKLGALPGDDRWVFAFIYPSPDLTEWRRVLRSLPTDLHQWRCITSPMDFPHYLFISVWRPHRPASSH